MKILFEGMYAMDVSDCIDKILLDACKCTRRADLPVQDIFLLSTALTEQIYIPTFSFDSELGGQT